jgi:hypothetical protein
MLLLVALIVAVLVGLIRGGRLDALGGHPWRARLLPFLAVSLQVVAFIPDESASAGARTLAAWLHGISYALALTFVWINLSTTGMRLIGAGLIANALVIVANGGFMPVPPGAPGDANAAAAVKGVENNVAVISPHTRLWFLGDVLETPASLPFQWAFSVGDLALGVGVFILVQHLMCSRAVRAGGHAA